MKFRTEINIHPQEQNQIDYKSKILLLGSCFSENIGQKLSYYQFDTLVNPFGTLFNPIAIERVLKDSITDTTIDDDAIVEVNGIYASLYHHSEMSALTKEDLIKNVQNAQKQTFSFLKEASHVIITLGTSWIYEFLKNKEVVANCHKLPSNQFEKRILSPKEVLKSLERIIDLIHQINPSVKVVFTVSPVRHIKDGIIENNFSKSTLIYATNIIKNERNVSYFESYEIMIDDLRDYRFYKEDMIHPNQQAVDYIWDKFVETWVSTKTRECFKLIHSIQQGLQHKPFNKKSEAHQKFLRQLKDKITSLEQKLNKSFHA